MHLNPPPWTATSSCTEILSRAQAGERDFLAGDPDFHILSQRKLMDQKSIVVSQISRGSRISSIQGVQHWPRRDMRRWTMRVFPMRCSRDVAKPCRMMTFAYAFTESAPKQNCARRSFAPHSAWMNSWEGYLLLQSLSGHPMKVMGLYREIDPTRLAYPKPERTKSKPVCHKPFANTISSSSVREAPPANFFKQSKCLHRQWSQLEPSDSRCAYTRP